jgi:hypothetical protein
MSGILATDIVSIISRPDLVGQYLGETGTKTKRKLIDSLEGIIFIDEAYQLGGCPDPDAYGMESITEIVNFLDKYMALGIMIVAGYENEMNQCFFQRNEGLRRRFPNQYKLIDYEYYDLFLIFMKGTYNDFYQFYSNQINSKDPNQVFQASLSDIQAIFESFFYLNKQECIRNVFEKDDEGQFVLLPDGRKKKVEKKVKCYFPSQGGDVGILVSKFYNYFYTKNPPPISFIAGINDLGKINVIGGERNQEKIEQLQKKIIEDIQTIAKYFGKALPSQKVQKMSLDQELSSPSPKVPTPKSISPSPSPKPILAKVPSPKPILAKVPSPEEKQQKNKKRKIAQESPAPSPKPVFSPKPVPMPRKTFVKKVKEPQQQKVASTGFKFDQMKMEELKNLIKQNEIKGTSKLNRGSLVQVLQTFEQNPENVKSMIQQLTPKNLPKKQSQIKLKSPTPSPPPKQSESQSKSLSLTRTMSKKSQI